MGLVIKYTKEENQIILEHMLGTNPRRHNELIKRAQKISDQFLPHRTAEGIADHWRYLIHDKVLVPQITLLPFPQFVAGGRRRKSLMI
jgi:hypothetical protein